MKLHFDAQNTFRPRHHIFCLQHVIASHLDLWQAYNIDKKFMYILAICWGEGRGASTLALLFCPLQTSVRVLPHFYVLDRGRKLNDFIIQILLVYIVVIMCHTGICHRWFFSLRIFQTLLTLRVHDTQIIKGSHYT